MKLLAMEVEIKEASATESIELYRSEAQKVWEFYRDDFIREIYFTEKKRAVLIIECESKSAAENLLRELPLVKSGIIRFDLFTLEPYTGFGRLFAG